MLRVYTVSFFGHRMLENALEVEKHLEVLLRDLITQHEYVEFLIGRDGEFDLLAASAIRRAVRRYQSGGAYRTMQYARKTGKQYLSIGDSVPPFG